MKKSILSLLITILFSLTILGIRALPAMAQGGSTDFLKSCGTDSIDPDCNPPTLQQFELLFVKALVAAWSLGGLLWLGYFIIIAQLYFTSEQSKIEEAKKRFQRWIIGFVLFYLARAIIISVMGVLIADDTNCYAEFDNNAAFKFFFPEVCEP